MQNIEESVPVDLNPSVELSGIDPFSSVADFVPSTHSYQNIEGTATKEPILKSKIFCLKLNTWNWILFDVLLINIILMIGTLTTINWVRQGKNETLWEGGLTACENCDGDFEHEMYVNIAQNVCSYEDYDGFCSLFKDLAKAGTFFEVTEIISIAFLIVWLVRILLAILHKEACRDSISYAISLFSLCVHAVGYTAWFIISDASYIGPCDEVDKDNRKGVCGTDGPGMALASMILLLLANLLFYLIYSRRHFLIPTIKPQ